MIIRNNHSFTGCLALRLRDDDEEMINFIQFFFGGRLLHRRLNYQNPKHGDQIEWRTTNLDHVLEICSLLLHHAHFPAKKIDDIRQVKEFCEWRKTFGHYWEDEHVQEAERRMFALRESRIYRL
jgi:hypothetical protein